LSSKVAKLTLAATKRGDTPQSHLSTILDDVKTAIWSYDSEIQDLSAQWVNEARLEHTVLASKSHVEPHTQHCGFGGVFPLNVPVLHHHTTTDATTCLGHEAVSPRTR